MKALPHWLCFRLLHVPSAVLKRAEASQLTFTESWHVKGLPLVVWVPEREGSLGAGVTVAKTGMDGLEAPCLL